MWCVHCRQDVPALPSADRELCCPRCGEAIRWDAYQTASGQGEAGAINEGSSTGAVPAVGSQPPHYDGWELDEELRHIQRVLQAEDTPGSKPEVIPRPTTSRRDQAHATGPDWHVPSIRHSDESVRTVGDTDRRPILGAIAGLSLLLGATCFVCGGALVGWSLATGRHELWTVGLPISLAGQIGLVIGLVLQLDRLWHDHREASAKLDDMDEQLDALKAANSQTGVPQGPGVSGFYAHFASGANPHLLLTDLKSQLDLLAAKITQSER